MSRCLTLLSLLIIHLFSALSCQFALAANRQLEFGGVKLGVRADSLGIKLDGDRAWYRYKNKYYLSGYFNEPGHPISKIELFCKDADGSEKIARIGCGDSIENITKRFGRVLFEMCSNYHVRSRIDESTPLAYYNLETNQFWSFDQKTKQIRSIGIALLEDGYWQKCKKPFTSSDLSRFKLGISAAQLLGSDFDERNRRNRRYGLTESMSIEYDIEKNDFPITDVTHDCRSEAEVPKFKIRGFGCGEKAEDILVRLKEEVKVVCGPIIFDGTQRIWRYYIPETKEYWGFNDLMKVDTLGFSEGEDPYAQECDPTKIKTANSLGDTKPIDSKIIYEEDKWELIGINSNYIIQIDSKLIKKKGRSYKVWVYTRFKNSVCFEFCDSIYRSSRFLISAKEYWEFNCEDEQYRSLAYEYFESVDDINGLLTLLDSNKNPTGSPKRMLIESSNKIGGWSTIVDGDIQLIAKRICR